MAFGEYKHKVYLRFHIGKLFRFCWFDDCGEKFINVWIGDTYYRCHNGHWRKFGKMPKRERGDGG